MKQWIKEIDGVKVFYSGSIELNGMTVFNPSEEQLVEAGYVEYIPQPAPVEPDPEPAHVNEEEIQRLKDQLASEDYKIIKCMEAKLMKRSQPYDVAELTERRNSIRRRINELEENEQ